MAQKRFFRFTNIVFERIRSARPCPCKYLIVGGFEIFTIRAALWLLDDGIVMGFKHVMNEGDHLGANLPVPTTVVVVGKQAKKATSILLFSLPIQLPPVLSGSYWNGCSVFGNLSLLLIVVVPRVNDPVAQDSSGKIGLAGALKEFSTDLGNTRGDLGWKVTLWRGQDLWLSVSTRLVPIAEDWCVPRF